VLGPHSDGYFWGQDELVAPRVTLGKGAVGQSSPHRYLRDPDLLGDRWRVAQRILGVAGLNQPVGSERVGSGSAGDMIDTGGTVTLRRGTRLQDVDVGRRFAGRSVLLLVQDTEIGIVDGGRYG
jgi:hypothetical protein